MLGVVNDIVGVSDSDMQAVAADLGFSETVFVDWCDPELDPSVRIFTPRSELPFAGHPLVGTAWTLSVLGPGATGVITTAVGPARYSIEGEMVWVESAIDMGDEGMEPAAVVAGVAGLPPPLASRTLTLPKVYHLCEYPTFEDVASLDPEMEALKDQFGLYAFAIDGHDVKARFFSPSSGVPEDPATGSAAVALAEEFRLRGETEGAVTILQGDEVDAPSTIHLRWDAQTTSIGGTVVQDEVVQVL
jgi:trans-2,3-dihydro-3-hydroxyanthranilate isomerase